MGRHGTRATGRQIGAEQRAMWDGMGRIEPGKHGMGRAETAWHGMGREALRVLPAAAIHRGARGARSVTVFNFFSETVQGKLADKCRQVVGRFVGRFYRV